MSDTKFWLGFSLVPEIGARRLALLLRTFGSAENAWHASGSDLKAAGLDDKPIGNLLATRGKLNLEAALERVHRAGAHLLTLNDDQYPALLRAAPDAPPLLYVRGTLTPADSRALAIVGTRRMTAYGREAAEFFSRELAAQGVTIVSGLAHGIDAIAHQAALTAGGRTIAILGSGIDSIYPSDHRGLAERVISQGALISEFPLGAKAEAHHFPRRNRMISGISLGVLIVEAPENSGALITASYAAEQGRDVFAVPGNIFQANAVGTHRLIQDGAKLAYRAQDILDEFDISYQHMQTQEVMEEMLPASTEEQTLLRLLGSQTIHADELIRLSQLAPSVVIAMLTVMELKGLIRSAGAMHYHAARPH